MRNSADVGCGHGNRDFRSAFVPHITQKATRRQCMLQRPAEVDVEVETRDTHYSLGEVRGAADSSAAV